MYLTPKCLHAEDEEYDMFEVSPTYEPYRNYETISRWWPKLKEFEVALPPPMGQSTSAALCHKLIWFLPQVNS